MTKDTYGHTPARKAFESAIAAQQLLLLRKDGASDVIGTFARLPNAEPALELYRRLADSA